MYMQSNSLWIAIQCYATFHASVLKLVQVMFQRLKQEFVLNKFFAQQNKCKLLILSNNSSNYNDKNICWIHIKNLFRGSNFLFIL